MFIQVCLKNISDRDRQNCLNEIRLIASVKHPNVVAFREAFIDHGSETMCIVMDYCEMGDLQSLMEKARKMGSNFTEQ